MDDDAVLLATQTLRASYGGAEGDAAADGVYSSAAEMSDALVASDMEPYPARTPLYASPSPTLLRSAKRSGRATSRIALDSRLQRVVDHASCTVRRIEAHEAATALMQRELRALHGAGARREDALAEVRAMGAEQFRRLVGASEQALHDMERRIESSERELHRALATHGSADEAWQSFEDHRRSVRGALAKVQDDVAEQMVAQQRSVSTVRVDIAQIREKVEDAAATARRLSTVEARQEALRADFVEIVSQMQVRNLKTMSTMREALHEIETKREETLVIGDGPSGARGAQDQLSASAEAAREAQRLSKVWEAFAEDAAIERERRRAEWQTWAGEMDALRATPTSTLAAPAAVSAAQHARLAAAIAALEEKIAALSREQKAASVRPPPSARTPPAKRPAGEPAAIVEIRRSVQEQADAIDALRAAVRAPEPAMPAVREKLVHLEESVSEAAVSREEIDERLSQLEAALEEERAQRVGALAKLKVAQAKASSAQVEGGIASDEVDAKIAAALKQSVAESAFVNERTFVAALAKLREEMGAMATQMERQHESEGEPNSTRSSANVAVTGALESRLVELEARSTGALVAGAVPPSLEARVAALERRAESGDGFFGARRGGIDDAQLDGLVRTLQKGTSGKLMQYVRRIQRWARSLAESAHPMAAMLRALFAQFASTEEGVVDGDAFSAMTMHMSTPFTSRAALEAALHAFGRPHPHPSSGVERWVLAEADFVRWWDFRTIQNAASAFPPSPMLRSLAASPGVAPSLATPLRGGAASPTRATQSPSTPLPLSDQICGRIVGAIDVIDAHPGAVAERGGAKTPNGSAFPWRKAATREVADRARSPAPGKGAAAAGDDDGVSPATWSPGDQALLVMRIIKSGISSRSENRTPGRGAGDGLELARREAVDLLVCEGSDGSAVSRFSATEVADAVQVILSDYVALLGDGEKYVEWLVIGEALFAADRSGSNELGAVPKKETRMLVACMASLPAHNRVLLERLLSHLASKVDEGISQGRGEAAEVERMVRAMRGVLLQAPRPKKGAHAGTDYRARDKTRRVEDSVVRALLVLERRDEAALEESLGRPDSPLGESADLASERDSLFGDLHALHGGAAQTKAAPISQRRPRPTPSREAQCTYCLARVGRDAEAMTSHLNVCKVYNLASYAKKRKEAAAAESAAATPATVRKPPVAAAADAAAVKAAAEVASAPPQPPRPPQPPMDDTSVAARPARPAPPRGGKRRKGGFSSRKAKEEEVVSRESPTPVDPVPRTLEFDAQTPQPAATSVSLVEDFVASPDATSLVSPILDSPDIGQSPVGLERDVLWCDYCHNTEHSLVDKAAHEAQCDWRPSQCRYCGATIILRDLEGHEAKCKHKLSGKAALDSAARSLSPSARSLSPAASPSAAEDAALVVEIWQESPETLPWSMDEVSHYDEAKFRQWLLEMGIPITVATRLKAEGGFVDGGNLHERLRGDEQEGPDPDWRLIVSECFAGIACAPEICPALVGMLARMVESSSGASHLTTSGEEYNVAMGRGGRRDPVEPAALSPLSLDIADAVGMATTPLVIEIWEARQRGEQSKLPWSLHDVASMGGAKFKEWLLMLGVPNGAARSLMVDGGCRDGEAMWAMLQTNLNWRADVTPCFDRIGDGEEIEPIESSEDERYAICDAFLNMVDAMVHESEREADEDEDDSYSVDFGDSPSTASHASHSPHSRSVSMSDSRFDASFERSRGSTHASPELSPPRSRGERERPRQSHALQPLGGVGGSGARGGAQRSGSKLPPPRMGGSSVGRTPPLPMMAASRSSERLSEMVSLGGALAPARARGEGGGRDCHDDGQHEARSEANFSHGRHHRRRDTEFLEQSFGSRGESVEFEARDEGGRVGRELGYERDPLELSAESVGSVHSVHSVRSERSARSARSTRSRGSERGSGRRSRTSTADQSRGMSSLGGAPPISGSSHSSLGGAPRIGKRGQ